MIKDKKLLVIHSQKNAQLIEELKEVNQVKLRSFANGIEALNEDVFDNVICEYNLGDPDCAKFMSEIKDTKSYNPNLIIAFTDVESDNPQPVVIDAHEVDNFISKAYEAPGKEEIFSLGDVPGLKIKSTDEVLSKVYLYSFEQDYLLLGARDVTAQELPKTLELVLDVSGKTQELTVEGEYEAVDPFGEDKDEKLEFLKFKFTPDETWNNFINEYTKNISELNDLIAQNLGED